jgi:hypothetical protein
MERVGWLRVALVGIVWLAGARARADDGSAASLAATDFTLTLYTPYKFVAYEVWRVVSQKQPAPKPNYAEAQRTRVTIGVMPARGSTHPLKDLVLKHGGGAMMPLDRSVSAEGGRFTFDYPAFAATADVTLDLIGQAKTTTCRIPQAVLRSFR